MKKSNHGNNCVDLEAEQVSEATQYGSLEEKAVLWVKRYATNVNIGVQEID